MALAAASYAAYILHFHVVVGHQSATESFDRSAVAKFGIVTVFGVVMASGIGHYSRRVPGLRSLLGPKPAARSPVSSQPMP